MVESPMNLTETAAHNKEIRGHKRPDSGQTVAWTCVSQRLCVSQRFHAAVQYIHGKTSEILASTPEAVGQVDHCYEHAESAGFQIYRGCSNPHPTFEQPHITPTYNNHDLVV